MGEMVERNHDLIMEYYSDVLANAEKKASKLRDGLPSAASAFLLLP
jgi:hypothetical protein